MGLRFHRLVEGGKEEGSHHGLGEHIGGRRPGARGPENVAQRAARVELRAVQMEPTK